MRDPRRNGDRGRSLVQGGEYRAHPAEIGLPGAAERAAAQPGQERKPPGPDRHDRRAAAARQRRCRWQVVVVEHGRDPQRTFELRKTGVPGPTSLATALPAGPDGSGARCVAVEFERTPLLWQQWRFHTFVTALQRNISQRHPDRVQPLREMLNFLTAS